MMPKAFCSSLVVFAAALAAPAFGQSADDAAQRAAALDRALGPNADLPVPQVVHVPHFAWPQRQFPVWLAAPPYRQQPLLTAVPRSSTVGGRTRTPGAP